ncbi:MAG: hypothetical protein ACRDN6_05240 [Gaiellaceae bacterium]
MDIETHLVHVPPHALILLTRTEHPAAASQPEKSERVGVEIGEQLVAAVLGRQDLLVVGKEVVRAYARGDAFERQVEPLEPAPGVAVPDTRCDFLGQAIDFVKRRTARAGGTPSVADRLDRDGDQGPESRADLQLASCR